MLACASQELAFLKKKSEVMVGVCDFVICEMFGLRKEGALRVL